MVLQKKQRRAHFESDDEEEEEEAGRGREEGRRRMEEARKSEISQVSFSFCLDCMYVSIISGFYCPQVFGGDDSDDEELPPSGLQVSYYIHVLLRCRYICNM